MQKFLSIVLVGVALVLSGCASEKQQVQVYLDAVDASQEMMKATATEMQASMEDLRPQIAGGEIDGAAVRASLTGFENKMSAEKAKVAAFPVPEKAKAHHALMLEQYGIVIQVMKKTGPMLELAETMLAIQKKYDPSKPDPKALEAIKAELAPHQEVMGTHQTELMELATKGQGMDMKLKEERQKLADSVGIVLPTKSPAPAGAAPAGNPAPAGSPAPATTPSPVGTPVAK